MNMTAEYSPRDGPGLEVQLSGKRRRFILDLTFEPDYELDAEKRDSLVPALSRDMDTDFLEQYYHIFEPLKRYIKVS